MGDAKQQDVYRAHPRFRRKVWIFQSDLTGLLAKWLVKLSPYQLPDNFETCLRRFDNKLQPFGFNVAGMTTVDLEKLTIQLYAILVKIPEIKVLGQRKNGREGDGFHSSHWEEPEPDDDFIDLMALARNITCDLADREDANCWLDSQSGSCVKEEK